MLQRTSYPSAGPDIKRRRTLPVIFFLLNKIYKNKFQGVKIFGTIEAIIQVVNSYIVVVTIYTLY